MLSAAIIREFPQYFPSIDARVSLQKHHPVQPQPSARRDPTWTLKTGYTRAPVLHDRHRAAQGRRLIAVVIDAGSEGGRARRKHKGSQLRIRGLRHLETLRQRATGAPVAVWRAAATVAAGFADDYFVSIPKGFSDALKAGWRACTLIAPISAGRGSERATTFNGQPFGERTLVALQTSARNVSYAGGTAFGAVSVRKRRWGD